MEKLILDYSKWRCGGSTEEEHQVGEGNTALLNNEGFMCCLGQVSLQLGAKESDIKNVATPDELEIEISLLNFPVEPEWDWDEQLPQGFSNTSLSAEAMEINDNIKTTPEEKIEALKELFKNHDYELEVINKP
jgi:hypothetical protein